MNRPRTIAGFAFFYGILFVILGAVGDSITSNTDVARVAGVDINRYYNESGISYSHLWDNAMEAMGIMEWHDGEYGMSDRIKFNNVYVSSHSYSEQFTQSSGDNIIEQIFNALTLGHYDPSGLKWEHENMVNLSNGEHIYIYPHLKIDLPGGDWGPDEFIPNLQQYIFVRTFDGYSVANEWISDVQTRDVSSSGDRCQWIPRLDCGIMGEYTLYYVIDVAYFDQSLINAIPGLNLLTDTDLEELIKEDKARFMERYGGIILGDSNRDAPSSLSYHEMNYQASGGLSTFFDVIHNIAIGWTAFQDYGPVSDVFNIFIGFFTLIFSLVVYYEIKSYLPFISGGEGGD